MILCWVELEVQEKCTRQTTAGTTQLKPSAKRAMHAAPYDMIYGMQYRDERTKERADSHQSLETREKKGSETESQSVHCGRVRCVPVSCVKDLSCCLVCRVKHG